MQWGWASSHVSASLRPGVASFPTTPTALDAEVPVLLAPRPLEGGSTCSCWDGAGHPKRLRPALLAGRWGGCPEGPQGGAQAL